MNDQLLIKQNLLDLDMQKYLQLASTSVIIFFSYFIGVFIIYITDQIDFSNREVYRLLIITSIFFLGYSALLFIIGFNRIRKITLAIRNMYDEVN